MEVTGGAYVFKHYISEKDLGLLCTYTAYIYQCREEDQPQSVLKIFLEELHSHVSMSAQNDSRCLAGVCNEHFKIGFYSTCDIRSWHVHR